MTFPDRIERTVELAHPAEKVWAAITTAQGLGTWFGDAADIDLRPGGEAPLKGDGGGAATLTVQVVEPPTRFAYTWGIEGLPDDDPRRTFVEFRLTPGAAGTTLTVVETGFAQLPPDKHDPAYGGNADGWRRELDELVEYLDAAA
jgi:uncharacterized protein YndB with AHSA1/START domain